MPSLEALAEALSAAEGGAVSTAVLYPLEVIKTVIQAQQSAKKKGKGKAEEASSGGGGGGGGGSEPDEQEQQEEAGEAQQEAGEAAVAAAAAAATTRAVTPASFASAAEEEEEGEKVLTVRAVAQEIFTRHGVAGFFEGVRLAAAQSAIEKAVYFYAYSTMRGITKLLTGGPFSLKANLLVGYLSEVVHLPLTVPLEVLTTRIITSKNRVPSLAQALEEALKEGGLSSLYKGITAYPVLCLKPALQYTCFEQLRKTILALLSRRRGVPVKSLTAAQAFLLGAFSRAVATVVLFPWIRVRKQLMAAHNNKGKPSTAEEEEEGTTTVVAALTRTYEDGGLRALFQGMGPELTRGVLSAALMLMLKERLYGMNRTLLLRQRGGQAYK